MARTRCTWRGRASACARPPRTLGRRELREAVAYCHARGVKVYVTCNTLPRNGEFEELPSFLTACQDMGVDAFIISDLGVLALAGKVAPQVERHISTQTGIVNFAAAQVCWELGAKRVVLAREVPLSEIKGIRERVDPGLELEAFVHGAMCMSFSGRCVISNYMTGRDANRGECAQPCRWEYHLVEAQRPGEVYSLVQEEKGAYFFNSNDLRMIDAIPQMMDAGITSLKIEGRAKSAYYVACVTAAYRRAIDFAWEHPGEPLPAAILAETEKISHRPYSHGFVLWGEPARRWTAATTPGATSWWPCARAGRTAWSPCGSATGFSRARRWISSSGERALHRHAGRAVQRGRRGHPGGSPRGDGGPLENRPACGGGGLPAGKESAAKRIKRVAARDKSRPSAWALKSRTPLKGGVVCGERRTSGPRSSQIETSKSLRGCWCPVGTNTGRGGTQKL